MREVLVPCLNTLHIKYGIQQHEHVTAIYMAAGNMEQILFAFKVFPRFSHFFASDNSQF
jgi:hypothetical protein